MNNGRFGIHGGQYIPETLMNAVIELEEAYNHYKDDPEFQPGAHGTAQMSTPEDPPASTMRSG